MLSVAKGFLFSRITGEQTAPNPTEEERNVVTGAARFIISWGNDTTPANASINLRDVRDSARKSVNAVLSRSRKSIDINDIAASYGLRSQNSRPLSDSVLHGDQTALAETALDQSNSENAFSSQRSRFAGEEVALAAKLPQNARVVERIAAAPLPCSLLATSDTLGRIFVQDSRDLCVLRVLKGYRDAHVAWVAQGGPLLAILAPRLNVLELHRPLDVKRIAAFRLRPGSMLVQSAMHRALCISPDGHLYELMRSRKSGGVAAAGIKEEQPNGKAEELETAHSATVNGVEDMTEAVRTGQSGSVVDYESLHMFLEAVKRGQTSVAVECLQNVRDSRQKVAHLMTAVLTCASYVRPEIHIALSSKAAQIASSLEDRDLLSRFEAHSRLAEAYAIVFAEILPEGAVAEENSVAKYGKQLMEDDIGAGLLEFAVEAMKGDASPANVSGKRTRSSKEEGNMLTCERFILSHALHPSMDIRSRSDYILRPRRDISEAEQVWLAKLYFSRLLHVDSADLPTEGREHPATKDVFLALSEVIGLQEAELAHHFAIFFLHVPLLALLKTRVAIHASPIRCAISRLRTGFSQEIVDQVLIEECETSACIPNAVLLTRLCVIHERRRSDGNDALFLASLDRLEEVLLFRKLIAGSKIPPAVYEKFTARGCSGALGDAERHAVTSLIEWHEFDRAAKILIRLDESRRGHKLAWQESASVSEAALLACRKKAVSVITDAGREVIPENVVSWILSVEVDEDQSHWIQLINEQRETVLRKLRSVLLSAHQYFSDSSVDAVRCLQLAEAMSALIELEINWHTKSKASATGPHENPESVAESGNQRPKRDSSTMGESKDFGSRQNAIIDHVNTDETQRSSPINNAEESNEVCEIVEETRMHTSEASLITTNELERDRLGRTGTQGKGDFFSGEGPSTAAEGTSHVHPFAIPTLENTGLDDDALDPVPTLSDGSDRMEDLPDTRAKVPKGSSGAEIDRRVREDTQNNDSDEDDDMFFDAASRQASDLLAADENNDAAMVPEIADN
ncbi:unnamed protein product [Chondrus crispus]|uniref:Rab3-GAP regulatory subunit N-terminal domain-containing protein n=1 Tax=Chondrus crispus TaxID=2769 RepID=R7QQE9_CHOCR|nr:unnamed protein product [Chondrus crispus]CDF40727.1 unnamed protein product [Chondrus crispus]|eukprot:XP_005711021.1 unnamed protein product [Chondrus crispus]